MEGTIYAERKDYIAFTFSSLVFGFVDDLEMRIDSIKKVIYIRSASRVGYGDAGLNKKRTELHRKLYNMEDSE